MGFALIRAAEPVVDSDATMGCTRNRSACRLGSGIPGCYKGVTEGLVGCVTTRGWQFMRLLSHTVWQAALLP